MPLIKPKEVTLTSNVGGEKKETTFLIGRYPADKSVEMITRGAAVLRDAAKGSANNSVDFAKSLQQLGIDMCEYVEALVGESQIPLTNSHVRGAHIGDADMYLQLMREVHDHNTNFMNSGRLLKTSLSLVDQAKAQITRILSQFSDSSSAKSKQRSKS